MSDFQTLPHDRSCQITVLYTAQEAPSSNTTTLPRESCGCSLRVPHPRHGSAASVSYSCSAWKTGRAVSLNPCRLSSHRQGRPKFCGSSATWRSHGETECKIANPLFGPEVSIHLGIINKSQFAYVDIDFIVQGGFKLTRKLS